MHFIHVYAIIYYILDSLFFSGILNSYSSLPTVIPALKIVNLSYILNSSQVMKSLPFLIRAKTRIFLFSNEGQYL